MVCLDVSTLNKIRRFGDSMQIQYTALSMFLSCFNLVPRLLPLVEERP
jgi:hypothetical protein